MTLVLGRRYCASRGSPYTARQSPLRRHSHRLPILRLAASATRQSPLRRPSHRSPSCRQQQGTSMALICVSRHPIQSPTVPFAAPLASLAFTSTTAGPVNAAIVRLGVPSTPRQSPLQRHSHRSPSRRQQQPPSMALICVSRSPIRSPKVYFAVPL